MTYKYKGVYKGHIKSVNEPNSELLTEFEIAGFMVILIKHGNHEFAFEMLIKYLEDMGRLIE